MTKEERQEIEVLKLLIHNHGMDTVLMHRDPDAYSSIDPKLCDMIKQYQRIVSDINQHIVTHYGDSP